MASSHHTLRLNGFVRLSERQLLLLSSGVDRSARVAPISALELGE